MVLRRSEYKGRNKQTSRQSLVVIFVLHVY